MNPRSVSEAVETLRENLAYPHPRMPLKVQRQGEEALAILKAALKERDERIAALERGDYMGVIEAETERRGRAEAELARLREALRANVGDAYNLLTQGESPTQLRGPSAKRIYERSRAALAETANVAQAPEAKS